MVREALFGTKSFVVLGKLLDRSALTQRVISSNVANVTTPGYERLGVDFGRHLRRAYRAMQSTMKRTHPKHVPAPTTAEDVSPDVVRVQNGYWNGINNVNMEQEMVDLAKNQLDFNIGVKLLNSKFTQLRTAIRGRR